MLVSLIIQPNKLFEELFWALADYLVKLSSVFDDFTDLDFQLGGKVFQKLFLALVSE